MRFAFALVASAVLITALVSPLPRSTAAQHLLAPRPESLSAKPTPQPTATLVFKPLPGRAPAAILRSKSAVSDPLAQVIEQVRSADPVYSDTFSKSFGLWTTTEHANSAADIHDGALHISLAGGSTAAAAVAGLTLDNFLLEVDTQRAVGEGDFTVNLVYRMDAVFNLYALQVRSDGTISVSKADAGEPIMLLAPMPVSAFRTGVNATNRLGVLAQGPRMAFLINGAMVAQVVDQDMAQGLIALGASSEGDAAVDVAFDNLQVWDAPPLTSAAPTLAPQPTTQAQPGAIPTPIPEPSPVPPPQPAPEPAPTATRKPVSIESLRIDWSAFEPGFTVSNVHLQDRSGEGTNGQVVVFDVEALDDVGLPIFSVDFLSEDGKWLSSSSVTLTPDPAATDRVDFIGQWLQGAYGTGEFELPGSVTRVDKTVLVRVY